MALYGVAAMTLWTVEDVANTLKLEYRYVRDRLAKRKDFPKPYRIGSVLRWKPEEIEQWLEKRKI